MKIGILGGGQLARMIIEECGKFGFEFHILSKEKYSPAGQLTQYETVGDWNDEKCLKEFSNNCDIVTLENEFIAHDKIKLIEGTCKKVFPGSVTMKLIQDKLYQKQTLEQSGIPLADYCEVKEKSDIIKFAGEHGYPVILKSRTMGYDGKGNHKIDSESEIDLAFDSLSRRGELMCESFINFDMEIATQAVRSSSGEIRIYPVVETVQKNHICHLVIASTEKFASIEKEVNDIAVKIITDLEYVGVMGIEMFLKGKKIIVNELAPRVHNSGHYTIEGSYTSQFENHLRAISNLPLGRTEMSEMNSVMINILGERNGNASLKNSREVLGNEKVYLHIYGKHCTAMGRKMGHITVTGDDINRTIETAKRCREIISI